MFHCCDKPPSFPCRHSGLVMISSRGILLLPVFDWVSEAYSILTCTRWTAMVQGRPQGRERKAGGTGKKGKIFLEDKVSALARGSALELSFDRLDCWT